MYVPPTLSINVKSKPTDHINIVYSRSIPPNVPTIVHEAKVISSFNACEMCSSKVKQV